MKALQKPSRLCIMQSLPPPFRARHSHFLCKLHRRIPSFLTRMPTFHNINHKNNFFSSTTKSILQTPTWPPARQKYQPLSHRTYPTSRVNSLNLEENLTSSPSTSAKTDFSYLSSTSKLKTCMEQSCSLRSEANALIGQRRQHYTITSRSNSNESIASHTSNIQKIINTRLRRHYGCILCDIDFNSRTMKDVNFLKILGITFDSKLLFKQ